MGKAIICLFAFFGVVSMGIFLLDAITWFRKKLSHKRVIMWKNRQEWESAVCTCAEKWIKKMPIVPLKDEERLIIIDMLRKQYKHSALQGWQYAQLISGLSVNNRQIKKLTESSFLISEIDDGYTIYQAWKSRLIDEDTAIKLTEKYLKIVKMRTKASGLIEYRDGFGDVCIVDTIAFVCPILVRYGVTIKKHEYVDLALKQIRTYYENAYLEKCGLYAHGYHTVTHTPCESIGWGRGTGWYLLGVLYCWQEIYESDEKKWLYDRMIEAAENIMKCQRTDGGWSTQLVSNWNYDSSATAIFGAFLFHVYEITHNVVIKEAGQRALEKLMTSTRKDGAIEYCEGACHGIGKYSINYSISPFTQGMVLDMIAESKKS